MTEYTILEKLEWRGRIENWQTINFGSGKRMFGYIYDSPKFTDGEDICTSLIKSHETGCDGEFIITKSGSRYLLGKPAFIDAPDKEVTSEER